MVIDTTKLPLFALGALVTTPGVLAKDPYVEEIVMALWRHITGDWGDLDQEDKAANDWALQTGERILSAYHLTSGEKIYIITEADRFCTTILLPEEY